MRIFTGQLQLCVSLDSAFSATDTQMAYKHAERGMNLASNDGINMHTTNLRHFASHACVLVD